MTGGTAGTQTILTLPRVQQWQIVGESSGQTGSVSLTNTNTPTLLHTHKPWFSLAVHLRFVTNLSNNLQGTTVFLSLYVHSAFTHATGKYTCARASMHLRQRSTHIEGRKHTYTHLRTQSSLCSAGERVGPQQGPPVLSWSPPVWPQATLCSQAAHHSLHTANRLSTWRES